MSSYVLFLLLGLGTGAVYAALGLGLVLAYRGSGVINFALGAMTMYVVYTYAELRDSGDLVNPIPGLPERLHLADTMPFVVALLLALATAALLGLLVHLLVFRPLRNATTLAKVVASVGIMIVLQAVVVLRFGTSVRTLPPILPDDGVEVFGVNVPRDRFELAGIVVLLGVGLWALSRFTRFGLSTRAAAESEKGASILGYSPDLISGSNWVLATVVAGGVGILVVPLTGLDPVNFTLLVVPALAAALVGRFTSFGATIAAGLVLGMAQSEITKLQVSFDWLPRTGVKEGLPLVAIVIVLFLGGQALPARGAIAEELVPVARSPRHVGLTALGGFSAGVAALFVLQGGYRYGLITSLVVAVVCLSLVVLTGYVGQISLAQMTFAGAAGFALSKLAADSHLGFPLAPLLSVAIATALGLVVGIPALRVRGVQLAVVTVAAAVAIEEFVFKNPAYSGGFSGSPVPNPELFGIDFGIRGGGNFPRPLFGVFVLAVFTVLAVAVANLRGSAAGRRLLAVRGNEQAAAAAGVSVTGAKLAAFTFASFLAAVGGVLIGYQRGELSASSFGVFASLTVLAIAYVGGISSISGALTGGLLAAGGFVFTVLDRWVGFGRYELLLSGMGLVLVAILYPEGVAGALRRAARRLGAGGRAATGAIAAMPTPGPLRMPPVRPPARRREGVPLLEAVEVGVTYAGVRAVDGVTLRIDEGHVVGLIGPNGAGKTTFIDALTGFAPFSSGHAELDGRPIDRLTPRQRARAGLARTFQSIQLFEDLSVRENVLVAAERLPWWWLASGVVVPSLPSPGAGAADWALDLLGLRAAADELPAELSHGQRKLVGIARAVAAQPRLLLLDEPAAGLDTHESRLLGERLGTLPDAGIAVLLVDHDMGLVLGVCDEVHVLDFGQVLASGSPSQIRRDPLVIAAYLGERADTSADTPAVPQ